MPDALRIGLLGPLQIGDEAGRTVHAGGRQLRVLLILLALDAGRVVPSGHAQPAVSSGQRQGEQPYMARVSLADGSCRT
jgi:hypothetical protein